MKILVTGAAGMLGHDLMAILTGQAIVAGVDLADCDIRDADACRSMIRSIHPDWIINAAAFTAVDECESNPDLAMAVNAAGAENLARSARDIGAGMVQVSTDYVFNGESDAPYCEADTPDPRTVYGRSKLEGEIRVRQQLPDRSLIVRTAWLFGLHGRNFVDTILGIAENRTVISVVNDQSGCPTFSMDLAAGIANLVHMGAHGIVNVTNSGTTTWHGFASYFLQKTHPAITVKAVSTTEFPRPAPRPKFSVLASGRFKSLTGSVLPDWKDAVDRYLVLKYPHLKKNHSKE